MWTKKFPLHGKRIFNSNLMMTELIAIYVVSKNNSNNEDERVEGEIRE